MTEILINEPLDREDFFHADYPFNNGLVTVSVDPGELREDTIAEAARQGFDDALARTFMEMVTFDFNNVQNVYDQYSDETRITKRVRKILNLGAETSGGGVWQDKKKLTHCAIPIETLVKLADKRKLNLPPPTADLVGDSKEIVLQQLLNKAWTHERQHLIQFASGTDHPKSNAIYRRVRQGMLGGFVTDIGSLMYDGVMHSSSPPNLTKVLTGLGLIGGIALLDKYQSRYSPDERQAYRLQNPNQGTPFQLSFRK